MASYDSKTIWACHDFRHLQQHGLLCSPLRAHCRLQAATPSPARRAATMSSSSSTVLLTGHSPSPFSQSNFEKFLLKTQDSICQQLAIVDGSGKQFCFDEWQRGDDPSLGYGITRVLENGNLLEKAAANVSIIHGCLSEARAKAMSARGRNVEVGSEYFAGALSTVFHPCNPHVPTFRSDVRYFEVGDFGWFGGGADLTPNYLDADDARYFHSFLRQLCDLFDPNFYQHSKAACDSYFYLPARKEHRGIGGIFFDDLEAFNARDGTDHLPDVEVTRESIKANRAQVFEFVRKLAEGFLPSYLPIVDSKRGLSYGDRERQWQLLRRGRYLEFNLLYDRGVRFGLDGGRIESIMVSAPPLIAWKYNVIPEIGSPEAQMMEVLQCPKVWT